MRAPPEVIDKLVQLGASKSSTPAETLRTRTGFAWPNITPLELAIELDVNWAVTQLRPVIHNPVPLDTLNRLQDNSHAIIRHKLGTAFDEMKLYLPILEQLTEFTSQSTWFPIKLDGRHRSYMYRLDSRHLLVWSIDIERQGSSIKYRVTEVDIPLVDEALVFGGNSLKDHVIRRPKMRTFSIHRSITAAWRSDNFDSRGPWNIADNPHLRGPYVINFTFVFYFSFVISFDSVIDINSVVIHGSVYVNSAININSVICLDYVVSASFVIFLLRGSSSSSRTQTPLYNTSTIIIHDSNLTLLRTSNLNPMHGITGPLLSGLDGSLGSKQSTQSWYQWSQLRRNCPAPR
ncbi:hypothetical protein B0H63DRAFT_558037 [Podospora didyma]|uniref:Uncharacterized protein n=1 Tax=Podospora didyma TaxID=330526 RepID=A0AAE0P0K4_9PEZI|nr:hypothetical protein B0H63DRAFT_558037 [Podospora didyma]